jgi:capsular exopolysaccharide synthesis family protein
MVWTRQLTAAGDVRFVERDAVRPTRNAPMLTSLGDPQSVVGEELRALRAKVQALSQLRTLRCVAMTSALPGEGKSTISVGLATAFARGQGARILLVEADLRRPTISKALGLPPAPGLAEWLNGDLDEVPIRRVEPGGFFLLVAGQIGLARPEVLGAHLMEALVRAAREAFDFTLFDAPPILPVADTILLQELVDGFLLVARSRSTPREAILESLAKLQSEKIIGVVLNDHREYEHSYSSRAYERYGMVHGPRSTSVRRKRR